MKPVQGNNTDKPLLDAGYLSAPLHSLDSVPHRSMEAFKGKFERTSEVQYDDFLKALGLNALMRAAATASTPKLEISEEDGQWVTENSTILKKLTLRFELGREFDYKTLDGRDTKTTITFEDGKIVSKQKATKEGETSSTTFMEMNGPDELIYTLTVDEIDNVKCVQKFKRIA